MATDEPCVRGPNDDPPDDLSTFMNVLNELKSTGCSLLVVGDAPREVFTRASSRLLGDADVVRYRVLGVTDATTRSVADRLPDPADAPRPLSETTQIVNYAGTARSVTTATSPGTPTKLDGIEETRVTERDLQRVTTALREAMDEVGGRAYELRPADLRVGIDSVEPLLDRYDAEEVRRRLDAVSEHVRAHDAMAHYVLPGCYDSDKVQPFVESADAVVELRTVDPSAVGHAAQQRWRVPQREVTTDWLPL